MPAETILYSLVSAIIGGVIVAFVNHLMARKREIEKKTSDIRIEYLVDCWMKIERASNIGPGTSIETKHQRYDELEQAIAKIMLLGDPVEVNAAKEFARNLANNSDGSVVKLLNSLRDSLRIKLGLKSADALGLFFRMQREPK